MLKFNKSDINLIIKNDHSVLKAKYSIIKITSAIHPNSKEIELQCEDEKGNSFIIKYAEINGKVADYNSILSYGNSGYILSESEESKFSSSGKTKKQKLLEEYEKIENKAISGFIEKVTKEEIFLLLEAEKNNKTFSDFNKMSQKYIEICIKYGLSVDHFRHFILKFEDKMKKFKPERNYVFNSVFENLKKGKNND